MGDIVVVLGAGSWGTSLAVLLANKGYSVFLWGRRPELVQTLAKERENTNYLPGIKLPELIQVGIDPSGALKRASLVVYAVPSHAFRKTLANTWENVSSQAYIVNVAKGIEEGTLLRMSQIFVQETGADNSQRYVALSGPSHAEEVARSLPTAVVAAATTSLPAAEYVQQVFMTPNFRVYTHSDLIGVELGGALKNIIALGAGISDGLGFGDNTKAALMTRGIAEILRLGVQMGANPLTFGGLAGIGDLIVTCTSRHSRNRRAGLAIGQGKSLEEALNMVHMVVEGVRTTRAAYLLSQKYQIEMPITEQIYQVLFTGLKPEVAVVNLMGRAGTRELDEMVELEYTSIFRVDAHADSRTCRGIDI
ncbi:MAG: NAD(P)H-dependent glycerol-3-phosphate dehydrogenase [bacterium]|jgi:glycerol-3-phosphate dehydrogenase (NAD(P)+)